MNSERGQLPEDAKMIGLRLENTYAQLPTDFFTKARPSVARSPRVIVLNHTLAQELGLDTAVLTDDEAAGLFSGRDLPGEAEPIAQAYAGHQFGSFTMLGDGRAILLGEHRTPTGTLVDIQFKGSGRTAFSRGGDGRAVLGPMLREYLISEAMHALGIPTTRSLAVVVTGEPVYRETLKRGAVLTRVAASHIRVGTFQYAAARGNLDNLRTLADYAIARHYPDLAALPDKYLAFLRAVSERQAKLIAQWQLVGFIHGVMNTDNMAVSGETIDYGPCAFMNAYHPDTVYSSIDREGRYAYANQPRIALWNLARFAETLLPLLEPDETKAIPLATKVLEEFPKHFEAARLAGFRRKLGLQTEQPEDATLVNDLLNWMQRTQADFTNTFRNLAAMSEPSRVDSQAPEFREWLHRRSVRLALEGRPPETVANEMNAVNPVVIPRNHRVEEAIAAAEQKDDLSVLESLLRVLREPFRDRPEARPYQSPPASERGYRTFCGT